MSKQLSYNICSISLAVKSDGRLGFRYNKAVTPATCGDAIDVPLFDTIDESAESVADIPAE